MKQIKFRGKTINEGEWIYGMTISHGTIARKRDNLYMEVSEGKWKGIDPETLGQFTGLLDKNGKEIYEGDILKGHTNKWKCESKPAPHEFVGYVRWRANAMLACNGCLPQWTRLVVVLLIGMSTVVRLTILPE